MMSMKKNKQEKNGRNGEKVISENIKKIVDLIKQEIDFEVISLREHFAAKDQGWDINLDYIESSSIFRVLKFDTGQYTKASALQNIPDVILIHDPEKGTLVTKKDKLHVIMRHDTGELEVVKKLPGYELTSDDIVVPNFESIMLPYLQDYQQDYTYIGEL